MSEERKNILDKIKFSISEKSSSESFRLISDFASKVEDNILLGPEEMNYYINGVARECIIQTGNKTKETPDMTNQIYRSVLSNILIQIRRSLYNKITNRYISD
jgi:hypothetical protein